MKAKLIKSDIQYRLHNEEGIVIATSLENGKLSVKNCEAIANGYDLDELAEEKYHGHVMAIDWQLEKRGFIAGFQKAVEILSDKKFSEEDMLKAIEMYYGKDKIFIEIIQSLQKTEWDVDIVMEKEVGTKLHDDGREFFIIDGTKPKLDANGCLILKRI